METAQQLFVNFGSAFVSKEMLMVCGSLLAIWLGFKVTLGIVRLILGFIKKVSFLSIIAITMWIGGFTTTTFSLGELASRHTSSPELSSDSLEKIALRSSNTEAVAAVLSYAKEIKAKNEVVPETVSLGNVNPVMSIKDIPASIYAGSLGFGIAVAVCGIVCWAHRRNPTFMTYYK